MTNSNYQKLLDIIEKVKPDIILTLETNNWWEKKLATLEWEFPNTIKCPQEDLYGMHLYSKLELISPQLNFLVEKNIPSISLTCCLKSGREVIVHFLHPAPPSPTENTTSKARDKELLLIAKTVKNTRKPIIVAGDLNDVAWSKTTRAFRRISKLLDPRIGRGMFNTFHSQFPLLRWPLDHIFHSKEFKLNEMKRIYLRGSDHFALYTQITLFDD